MSCFALGMMAFRRLVTSTGMYMYAYLYVCVFTSTSVGACLRRAGKSLGGTQRISRSLVCVMFDLACSPSGSGSACVRWQSSGVHAAALRIEIRCGWLRSPSRASLQESAGNPVRPTEGEWVKSRNTCVPVMYSGKYTSSSGLPGAPSLSRVCHPQASCLP